jgi:hypothetical protein
MYAFIGCLTHLEIIDDSLPGRALKLHYLAQLVNDAENLALTDPYYIPHLNAFKNFYIEEANALDVLEQIQETRDGTYK